MSWPWWARARPHSATHARRAFRAVAQTNPHSKSRVWGSVLHKSVMASPIFILKPPPGFSMLAVARGFQLALLGALRSLQNPAVFNLAYFRQTLIAIQVSVLLQLLIWSPIIALRILVRALRSVVRFKGAHAVVQGLKSFQFNVLNISVFLVSAYRYYSKLLDTVFLQSLEHIDAVYEQKHKRDAPYHRHLVGLSQEPHSPPFKPTLAGIRLYYALSSDFAAFINRHARRLVYSVCVFVVSKLPFGRFALGAISFLNLNDKIGTLKAAAVFFLLQLAPRRYSVMLLTTYWGTRAMVHDLLLPYFSRVRFTKSDRNQWIKLREGLLFGFGLCYYILIRKMPWVGLLIYGFAESLAAYLITKVLDPPPPQSSQLINWSASQLCLSKDREQHLLKGEFGQDGFEPLPGAFVFESPLH